MGRNPPNFFTTPSHNNYSNNDEEELDEYDVVWSDHTNYTTAVDTIGTIPASSAVAAASPRKFTAGISAAILGDELSRSPTSVQRKTASSPVAMISSSYLLSRGGSNGGSGGGGFHMSAPVNVPIWPNSRPKNRAKFWGEDDDEVEDEDDDDGEMVPPHEMVARSRRSSAFSVIEGAGRTLKGRDLTQVRNAVFQKTGFID